MGFQQPSIQNTSYNTTQSKDDPLKTQVDKWGERKGREWIFTEHLLFHGHSISHLLCVSHLILRTILWCRVSSIWVSCPGPTASTRLPGLETRSVWLQSPRPFHYIMFLNWWNSKTILMKSRSSQISYVYKLLTVNVIYNRSSYFYRHGIDVFSL